MDGSPRARPFDALSAPVAHAAAVAHPYVSQYGALLNTVISRMVLRKKQITSVLVLAMHL